MFDYRHKLFYAITSIGCVANFLWFLITRASSGWSPVAVICLVCAVIAVSCAISGAATHHITLPSLLLVLLMNFIEFPFLYYYLGTPAAIYLILGLYIVTVYITGHFRIIIFTVTCLMDTVLLLSGLHPSGTSAADTASRNIEIYAYIISAAAIYLMTSFIESQYEDKNNRIMHKTERLEKDANIDPLTGVYNRRFMMKTLEKTLKGSNNFYISLLDIDNFKQINDTYGHVYGDYILRELGRLMKENAPSDVMVSRYGGEEFFMIYRSEDQDTVFKIINSIKDQLGKYSMQTRRIKVTFSCGVVRCSGSSRPASLLTRVDSKLYKAKKNGKNRIEI